MYLWLASIYKPCFCCVIQCLYAWWQEAKTTDCTRTVKTRIENTAVQVTIRVPDVANLLTIDWKPAKLFLDWKESDVTGITC